MKKKKNDTTRYSSKIERGNNLGPRWGDNFSISIDIAIWLKPENIVWIIVCLTAAVEITRDWIGNEISGL